jgi:hypothetical protein
MYEPLYFVMRQGIVMSLLNIFEMVVYDDICAPVSIYIAFSRIYFVGVGYRTNAIIV